MFDLTTIPSAGQSISTIGGGMPTLFLDAGPDCCRKVVEFFAATIRNPNTRQAYGRAVRRFADWCTTHGLALATQSPFVVAAYVEELGRSLDRPSVKQHLAALRMLCDHLVVGQVIPSNPAASVRGPKHVVARGKTPVLLGEEARELLDSIDFETIGGLRDRALIGVMIYSFARVGAVVAMDVADYFLEGKRWFLRLHEKGGKLHVVPAHHKVDEYLDSYLADAGLASATDGPLFRTLDRRRQLTDLRMSRREVHAMVKRRCKNAGLAMTISPHSFRASGITAYLCSGGTLEHAQRIAAHSSPRTTKLYDRTSDEISIEEIERIQL